MNMNRKCTGPFRTLATLALATLGIIISGAATAREFNINYSKYSGSFLSPLPFSFTGEGTTSTTVTGIAARLGVFEAHIMTDFNFGSDCTSSDGIAGTEFFIVDSQAVLSSLRGQLYLEFISGQDNSDGCVFDGTDGLLHFELEASYHVIGGSGNFAGAQGSFDNLSEGVLLENNFVNSTSNQFGGTTGSFVGSFSTP